MINSLPGQYKWLKLKCRESKADFKMKCEGAAGGYFHTLRGSLHHTMGDIVDGMLAPGGYHEYLTPATT